MKNNSEIDILELVRYVWANRKKIIICTLVSALVGSIVAFSIPREWETVVKVAPEGAGSQGMSSSVGGLMDMVSGGFGSRTASADGISATLYPEVIGSRPFLLEFADIRVPFRGDTITMFDYIINEQKKTWWSYIFSFPNKALGWTKAILGGAGVDGKDDEQAMPVEFVELTGRHLAFVGVMKRLTSAQIDAKTKRLIEIKVLMQEAKISAIVADSMVAKFNRYIVDYKTSKARRDVAVTEKILEQARRKYYEVDSSYAAAADRNTGLSRSSSQIKLDRLEAEKNIAFSVYQQAATRLESARLKVQEDTPVVTIVEPAVTPMAAKSPNKPVIIAIFLFIGGLSAVIFSIIKFLKTSNEGENS
ncbi:putative protein involved in capsular polysaccharide biosynthesis [Mucinivorans hirudinis]|uniref:Polysaccharide chain length determinant N-terminal domain-containing protein n=1 Tax=Mucinivorans hirudinis TaxID=1433126 RepID=A0A060RB06_9BACT|nr:putative protein involved in capsular polysaccharide biosynthesis [Mucinivorans hirudinis]